MARAIPTKESFIKEYRGLFPNWTDEQVEKHASLMVEKYATLKFGSNVVHLDYYDGIIRANEITEIEERFKNVNIELSRFDKTGVAYANLEDFTLQMALIISSPVVQNILLGIGTNAIWDGIKATSHSIWKKVKLRLWDVDTNERKSKINFGLSMRLGNRRSLDLKLDGELNEQTVLQALDKVLDLVKLESNKDAPNKGQFFVFDSSNRKWKEINVKEEMYKIALRESKKNK